MANEVLTTPQIMDLLKTSERGKRGLNIYSLTELRTVSAVSQDGNRLQVTYQHPRFTLTLEERVQMARFSSMVFGVIASRMNRVGSLEWNITRNSDDVDRESDRMNGLHEIWKEWEDMADQPGVMVMRTIAYKYLHSRMPEIRPDLANFGTAHQRWKKRVKGTHEEVASEAEDWLREPNQDFSFDEFLKQWVFDLHTHGTFSIYKEPLNGRLENFYALPGGAIIPIHTRHVGSVTGYIQIAPVSIEPLIYFNNEVSFSRWLPSTAMSYGLVPLESLVNKVAEQLLFDELAASEADGTKPPAKVVLVSEPSPFGDMTADINPLPIDKGEQQKIETIFNESRKMAIRIVSGLPGKPEVMDLSRDDIFQHQSDRQRQLKEDVALVFGATSMEMNLTGSGDTSGRATSESQERMEQKRGLMPILDLITNKINRDLLPYRFGPGYTFKFASGLSEAEQVELWTKKANSGLESVNEVRTNDMGRDPYPEEEYDRPKQATPAQPGTDESNPFFTSPLDG